MVRSVVRGQVGQTDDGMMRISQSPCESLANATSKDGVTIMSQNGVPLSGGLPARGPIFYFTCVTKFVNSYPKISECTTAIRDVKFQICQIEKDPRNSKF